MRFFFGCFAAAYAAWSASSSLTIAIPASVAIDEAIEIAKRFGSDESATFVNGVLDHVAETVGVKTPQRAL